ncbi:hypothetical protein PROFUN_07698 [Planoprotostelium fungivorum]|uniref:SH2 domain-containing protein n=1 Tax=Planoprotostelium fungivorum TaxID=1890364 RepID=A0A2P6MM64_9EUKA|nr:hypothetical protein PROFUN_07698 [Planoprotostelium fungivorum]
MTSKEATTAVRKPTLPLMSFGNGNANFNRGFLGLGGGVNKNGPKRNFMDDAELSSEDEIEDDEDKSEMQKRLETAIKEKDKAERKTQEEIAASKEAKQNADREKEALQEKLRELEDQIRSHKTDAEEKDAEIARLRQDTEVMSASMDKHLNQVSRLEEEIAVLETRVAVMSVQILEKAEENQHLVVQVKTGSVPGSPLISRSNSGELRRINLVPFDSDVPKSPAKSAIESSPRITSELGGLKRMMNNELEEVKAQEAAAKRQLEREKFAREEAQQRIKFLEVQVKLKGGEREKIEQLEKTEQELNMSIKELTLEKERIASNHQAELEEKIRLLAKVTDLEGKLARAIEETEMLEHVDMSSPRGTPPLTKKMSKKRLKSVAEEQNTHIDSLVKENAGLSERVKVLTADLEAASELTKALTYVRTKMSADLSDMEQKVSSIDEDRQEMKKKLVVEGSSRARLERHIEAIKSIQVVDETYRDKVLEILEGEEQPLTEITMLTPSLRSVGGRRRSDPLSEVLSEDDSITQDNDSVFNDDATTHSSLRIHLERNMKINRDLFQLVEKEVSTTMMDHESALENTLNQHREEMVQLNLKIEEWIEEGRRLEEEKMESERQVETLKQKLRDVEEQLQEKQREEEKREEEEDTEERLKSALAESEKLKRQLEETERTHEDSLKILEEEWMEKEKEYRRDVEQMREKLDLCGSQNRETETQLEDKKAEVDRLQRDREHVQEQLRQSETRESEVRERYQRTEEECRQVSSRLEEAEFKLNLMLKEESTEAIASPSVTKFEVETFEEKIRQKEEELDRLREENRLQLSTEEEMKREKRRVEETLERVQREGEERQKESQREKEEREKMWRDEMEEKERQNRVSLSELNERLMEGGEREKIMQDLQRELNELRHLESNEREARETSERQIFTLKEEIEYLKEKLEETEDQASASGNLLMELTEEDIESLEMELRRAREWEEEMKRRHEKSVKIAEDASTRANNLHVELEALRVEKLNVQNMTEKMEEMRRKYHQDIEELNLRLSEKDTEDTEKQIHQAMQEAAQRDAEELIHLRRETELLSRAGQQSELEVERLNQLVSSLTARVTKAEAQPNIPNYILDEVKSLESQLEKTEKKNMQLERKLMQMSSNAIHEKKTPASPVKSVPSSPSRSDASIENQLLTKQRKELQARLKSSEDEIEISRMHSSTLQSQLDHEMTSSKKATQQLQRSLKKVQTLEERAKEAEGVIERLTRELASVHEANLRDQEMSSEKSQFSLSVREQLEEISMEISQWETTTAVPTQQILHLKDQIYQLSGYLSQPPTTTATRGSPKKLAQGSPTSRNNSPLHQNTTPLYPNTLPSSISHDRKPLGLRVTELEAEVRQWKTKALRLQNVMGESNNSYLREVGLREAEIERLSAQVEEVKRTKREMERRHTMDVQHLERKLSLGRIERRGDEGSGSVEVGENSEKPSFPWSRFQVKIGVIAEGVHGHPFPFLTKSHAFRTNPNRTETTHTEANTQTTRSMVASERKTQSEGSVFSPLRPTERKSQSEGSISFKPRPTPELDALPWFHGYVKSTAVVHRLLDGHQDGTWLIRRSSTVENGLAISVVFQGKINHFRILYMKDSTGADPVFVLSAKKRHYYSSLEELVESCSRKNILSNSTSTLCRLTAPLVK